MSRGLLAAALILAFFAVSPVAHAQAPEDKEIGGKKLKQWIAEIRHQDPSVREAAIRAVIHYGKDARKAGKSLIVELRDADPSLRSNAAIAIGIVGLDREDLEEGVKGLGKLVQSDPQASVRVHAAIALATFGPDAKAAVAPLASVFRDTYASWEIRRAAAIALGKVAYDPTEGPLPQAISALAGAVRSDSSKEVRLHAITALIFLGKGAIRPETDPEKIALRKAQAEALQTEKRALENAVKDPDKLVSLWARVALMRIDKVEEVHLIQIGLMLKSADTALRVNAAQALAAIGPEAKSQVPALIVMLKDPNTEAAAAAAIALAGMGEEAQSAVPTLKDLAAGTNEVVKAAAQAAITQINGENKPKKPAGK
jgi:HEAT repeat protein